MTCYNDVEQRTIDTKARHLYLTGKTSCYKYNDSLVFDNSELPKNVRSIDSRYQWTKNAKKPLFFVHFLQFKIQ